MIVYIYERESIIWSLFSYSLNVGVLLGFPFDPLKVAMSYERLRMYTFQLSSA